MIHYYTPSRAVSTQVAIRPDAEVVYLLSNDIILMIHWLIHHRKAVEILLSNDNFIGVRNSVSSK